MHISSAEFLTCITLFSINSLGPLVGKVKDYQVEVIVDTLCNNMVGDKEQLRDISSIGLKTVINELPLTTQTLAATGNRDFDRIINQDTIAHKNYCCHRHLQLFYFYLYAQLITIVF